MKKHRLKIYLKLGILLFGISLCCLTCQKDDNVIVDEPNLQHEFKLNLITKSEVNKNQKVNSIIQTLPKANDISSINSNLQGRSIYIEEYDFYVDDEIAYHITYGNYESYTFAIHRNEDKDLVENLLLSKQADGSYKASIISYDLNEAEKQTVKNGTMPIGIEDKTSIEPLPKVTNSTESDIILIGSTGIYYDTSSGGCVIPQFGRSGEFAFLIGWAPVGCPEGFIDSISANDNGNTGGGNVTGDDGLYNPNDNHPTNPDRTDPNNGNSDTDNPFGDLTGSGNGNGTGNPNDSGDDGSDDSGQDDTQDCIEFDTNGNCIGEATAILIPVEDNETSPCESLKNLSKTDSLSANIKPILDSLKTKTNLNKEWYIQFERKYENGAYKNYPQSGGIKQGVDKNTSKIETWTFIIGAAHTHPEDTNAMFSWLDLQAIRDIYRDVGALAKNMYLISA